MSLKPKSFNDFQVCTAVTDNPWDINTNPKVCDVSDCGAWADAIIPDNKEHASVGLCMKHVFKSVRGNYLDLTFDYVRYLKKGV